MTERDRPRGGYLESQVQRFLAEDPRLAEQGLTVERHGGQLLLVGTVESELRREQVERLVSERFPDAGMRCDLEVAGTGAPAGVEELS